MTPKGCLCVESVPYAHRSDSLGSCQSRGSDVRLTRVHVRFFKSFNFDYERRAKESATRYGWEELPEGWYPHVRLDVDPHITAVVGANESGKSHLLDAVERIVGERAVTRSDFCRYSQLYSVESEGVRLPDVGGAFTVTEESEVAALATLDIACAKDKALLFMRPGEGTPFVLCDGVTTPLDEDGVSTLEELLPKTLRFSTGVAIPDSVPIAALWGGPLGGFADRGVRSAFLDEVEGVEPGADETVLGNLSTKLLSYVRRPASPVETPESRRREAEIELARKLLIDVARVDPTVFRDLQSAISRGREGEVSGLEARINLSLSRHLNFSRWWSQDSDFQLRVIARERELSFIIRDKTGTDYSFAERSRGLTHFLAYFVQLRSHHPEPGRSELLLMDEPDAYLSNAGQQDLLRVLENYALPDDRSRADQVLYVTHSPFLINKNAAWRLRVLDKGPEDEGTRVVKDVARTHYEPLRSALGAHAGETAFIGGANLIVEGAADQVLLAGMSNALRLRGVASSDLLDLNNVTIVPAGSADSVPYIAYLARGRDPVKPPCVALLDGDDDGRRAVAKLRKSEANRKPVLVDKYVVSLDAWARSTALKDTPEELTVRSAQANGDVVEIEDLIPPKIAILAARAYASRLLGASDEDVDLLRDSDLKDRLESSGGLLWDELQGLFREVLDERIDKVGFAREVVAYLCSLPRGGSRPPGVPALEQNFRSLLRHLTALLEDSSAEEAERRRNKRMGRVVRGFLDDFQTGAPRSVADSRLREVESSLDETVASHDAFRLGIARLRREFELRVDPEQLIENFSTFRQKLEDLTRLERLESLEPGPAEDDMPY